MSSASAHLRPQSIAQSPNRTRADQRHTRHSTRYHCSSGRLMTILVNTPSYTPSITPRGSALQG
jgi:hypothetical protein